MNVFLYMTTVLIWGTTWFAISVQSSFVEPVIGVFWRMAIAAALLAVIAACLGRLNRLSVKNHMLCMIQGATIFGLNFYCFYTAAEYVSSGLESVIFSTVIIFNALNSWVFLKQKPSIYFVPSAVLGIAGITILFWPDISSSSDGASLAVGVILCFVGTFAFSAGSTLGVLHLRNSLDSFTTTTYAMGYSALIMLTIAVFSGSSLYVPLSMEFTLSLLYLAVMGSTVAFTVYFVLASRIGSSNAGYATLLFPIVALFVSSFFEDFAWSPSSVAGVALIGLGNLILFTKPKLSKFRSFITGISVSRR